MLNVGEGVLDLDARLMSQPKSQLFEAMDNTELSKDELEMALGEHYIMTHAFVPALKEYLGNISSIACFEELGLALGKNLADETGRGETKSHSRLYGDLLRENFGKIPNRRNTPDYIKDYVREFNGLIARSDPFVGAGAIYSLEHQMAGMGGQFASVQKQLAALGLRDTGYFQHHIDLDGNPEKGHAALERKAVINTIKTGRDFYDFETGALRMAELRTTTFNKVYSHVKGK